MNKIKNKYMVIEGNLKITLSGINKESILIKLSIVDIKTQEDLFVREKIFLNKNDNIYLLPFITNVFFKINEGYKI